MAAQGRKFLEGQVEKLKESLEKLLKVNEEFQGISAEMGVELNELQDERNLLTDQPFFKAFMQFIHLRRKYKKS